MLHEGVESRSDGVHRIHWKRIDSDGKVHLSIRERFRKFHSCCMRGWKSRSVGVHCIHYIRIDSNAWRDTFSIRNGRSKIVIMLNEVEKMRVQASSTTRVSKGFILIFWMRLFFSSLVSFKNVLGQQRIDLFNWYVVGAFLWDDPNRNHWSKSTRIIAH